MTNGAENWVLDKKIRNEISSTDMDYCRSFFRVLKIYDIENKNIRRVDQTWIKQWINS